MSRIRTLTLLETPTALLLWTGQALGGQNGLLFALVPAGPMNSGAYWFSGKIVRRMYGAREISPAEFPDIYAMVRELAIRADLPRPRPYLMPEEAPNGFCHRRRPSTRSRGPDGGVVAIARSG